MDFQQKKTEFSSSPVVNIEDLRRMAHRRLPRVVFDYLDGGAEGELTLRENSRAFEEIYFRPRAAVAFSDTQLGVRVLGHQLAFPAILAPVGYTRHSFTLPDVNNYQSSTNTGIPVFGKPSLTFVALPSLTYN